MYTIYVSIPEHLSALGFMVVDFIVSGGGDGLRLLSAGLSNYYVAYKQLYKYPILNGVVLVTTRFIALILRVAPTPSNTCPD